MEPKYVDNPFEDDDWTPGNRRPKWMTPITDVEKRVFLAVGYGNKKFYRHDEKKERSFLKEISKSSVSVDIGPSRYPSEWIDYCCEWAEAKRAKGGSVGLKGIITFIKNEEARDRFLSDYRDKYEEEEDEFDSTGW